MSHPSGLPVPNPTESYWQTPPHQLASHRSTPSLPSTADYVVVGSGISGTSIAWHLHKLLTSSGTSSSFSPDNPEILHLEARTLCSGATGRNGGHCRTGRWLMFLSSLLLYGSTEALKMEKMEEDTVSALSSFAISHGIDCDLRSVETVDIFTTEPQWVYAKEALRARQKLVGREDGGSVTERKIWEREEARERLKMEVRGGVAYEAWSLSPYKLVCGMMDRLLKMGEKNGQMNLQTGTAVVRLEDIEGDSEGYRWNVITERGVVKAKTVILATNAYTGAVYEPVKGFLIPTRNQIATLRPGSKIESDEKMLKRTWGLVGPRSDDYCITRDKGLSGEGDMIFGKHTLLFLG